MIHDHCVKKELAYLKGLSCGELETSRGCERKARLVFVMLRVGNEEGRLRGSEVLIPCCS